MQSKVNKVIGAVLISSALALSTACSPVIHNHGYVFEDAKVDQLQRGQTTPDQVKQLLGTPTTTSVIENQSYYYIYIRQETYTYKKPEEVDRRVLAVYFGDDNTLSDFGYYGIENGNVVSFIDRATPTSGKEISFLQQIFGNLGRFDSGGAGAGGGGGR